MSSLFYYLLPSATEQRIRPYRNGGSVTVRTDALLRNTPYFNSTKTGQ